jgi:hypothetical protein
MSRQKINPGTQTQFLAHVPNGKAPLRVRFFVSAMGAETEDSADPQNFPIEPPDLKVLATNRLVVFTAKQIKQLHQQQVGYNSVGFGYCA